MHKSNKRQTLARRRERQALVTTLMSGKTEYGRIVPMLHPEAEKLASAILAKGFDLWVWAQGGVQFLTPAQLETAVQFGRLDLVKNVVEGSDSADPFYTTRGGWDVLTKHFPESFAVQTRCAGGQVTGHSAWAYGPIFLSKEAAKAAGFTHRTQCKCEHTAHPL